MTYWVRTGYEDGRAYEWWARFLAYSDLNSPDIDFDLQRALDHHDSRAKVNPSDYRIGDYIEFETEKDFTMFVLKWS